MKRDMYYFFFSGLVMGMVLTVLSGMAVASNVCSRGISEPPFLSYGAKSNLLMLLDNSGSMLDTAYTDNATNCFDDGYVPIDLSTDPPTLYAGTFQVYAEDMSTIPPTKIETWYKWVEVQPLWEHKVYSVGDRVYENGVIYEALSVEVDGAGVPIASSGANIYDDEAVEWIPITRPVWKAGTVYHAGSFVYNSLDGYLYYTPGGGTAAGNDLDSDSSIVDWEIIPTWENDQSYTAGDFVQWKYVLYKALNGGTSNGTQPWDDSVVSWLEINPFEWQAGTAYAVGDIVTYQGMIFESLVGHTSSGLTPYETDFSTNWLRIDEGYYEEVTAADALAACTTAAAVADNTKYTANGLCMTLYKDPTGVKPTRTTAFAASGNFLNWLTASKFDIQKSILTGGKFNVEAERVVSENRGCSGSRFTKQIVLDSGDFLTLAVRGPRTTGDPFKRDRIDGVDDTTRIEVLAVSATGYLSAACQDAVKYILKNGLNGSQNLVDNCLGSTSDASDPRNALNHALQDCWQSNTEDLVNDALSDCYNVYQEMDPSDISSWANAYHCYGIYDNKRLYDTDRVGYVGRCWSYGTSGSGSTCDPFPKDLTKCVGDPCEYSITDSAGTVYLLKNDSTEAYTQYCFEWKTAGVVTDGCKNSAKWADFMVDSATSILCNPDDYSDDTSGTVAEFSPDIDGIAGFTAADTALVPVPDDLTFHTPQMIGPLIVANEAAYCVQKAMEDYCSDINVPEVIDPTDQDTSTTGDFRNVPALLVDSGVLNQLGVNVPMNVMKGTAMRSISPMGILQKTASDLRIGAMAFNAVGADAECQAATTTSMIEKYCPSTNQDGAQVISPIKLGSTITGPSSMHVDDLVRSVNAVRATSWTPLAEAVYNAIGYYTQNTAMRLNDGDFQTDSDVTAGWQNNHYYGAGSYLMDGGVLYHTVTGGFSNGTNRGDDQGVVWVADSSYKNTWSNGTVYGPNDIVTYDGKLYQTASGGTATLKDEASALLKSGPLYDAGVIWDFLIDPVVNHCQGNYLLIITEGASTADINSNVEDFALGNHSFNTTAIVDANESAADNDVTTQCGNGLLGSTYVDDLTYFAQDANNEFSVYPTANATLPESDYPFDQKPKNNITTYIVTAGAPRDNGNADECNPAYLMDSAAANGGTDAAMRGENPQTLEDKLMAVFNELRQRSSAGSAASVISSARGGEGAIYQAIFWPELVNGDTKVEWAGDVHGLFLDENGYMYEDTDGDREMNPSEDLDGDGTLDVGEDANHNGILDAGEDKDNDGVLDLNEDLNNDGVFDLLADTDGDGIYDTGIDTTEPADGIPDLSEDIDGDGHFDRNFEDVNQNGTIDGDDQRVIIFFDKTPGVEKSRACWNTSILDSLGEVCTAATDLDQVHFLWSANQWLSDYPDNTGSPSSLSLLKNRSSAAGSFNADTRERYIFTWNDVDKDGIVGSGEVVDFEATADYGPAWVASDFDVADGVEVDKIIRWMRGEDFLNDEDSNYNGLIDVVDGVSEDINGNGRLDLALRSRQSLLRDPDDPTTTYPVTWRLGDIIHSTPMTVAAPAEGYHLIYDDYTYAEFVSRWKNRRHMVYFGANDGMLHAVNAGFYKDSDNKFWKDYGRSTDIGPALGTEMWAYVPYNMHPHLKCLTDPLYTHKYFVDLRPRIFDVQIFEEESACSNVGFNDSACIHPNGWGTILVGGMGLGGAPIAAADLTGSVAGDTREFISSYFILDITNPELPPELLGELTRTTDVGDGHVDLGFSTVIPTMVIMKDDNGTTVTTDDINEWYLVLGSGPHGSYAMKGVSDQYAKVSILPLHDLVNASNEPQKAFRIKNATPSSTNSYAGTWPLGHSSKSFVSDLITVDYDINPSFKQYKADAVYFGTVEDETGGDGFVNYPDGATYWSGGGHMYRLVMEDGGHYVGADDELRTQPHEWGTNILLDLATNGLNSDLSPNPHNLNNLNTIQPITAAASVGTDGYNFWIYFGTGRFFDADDKTDRQQQTYYGIKEPMSIVDDPYSTATTPPRRRLLTWDEVELTGTPTNNPGAKGVAQVDEILVGESTSAGTAPLKCRNNDDIPDGGPVGNFNCMDWASDATNAYFDKMERYIAGTGRCFGNNCSELRVCTGSDYTDPEYLNNCTDGWYKKFWPYNNREKNVGQATLLGGLVTFTTYQPNSGVCQAEGSAYLYGVYYKTGTSWFENIFGENGINGANNVKNKLSLGRGLATTPNLHVGAGGKDGEGPKAFVQTSTGEIKEIKQDNMPVKNYNSGRSKWREFLTD